MNASLCLLLIGVTLLGGGCVTHNSGGQKSTRKHISGWGQVLDPNNDCKFLKGEGELLIFVPAANGPHDLAAETGVTNAPRVLETVTGDFILEVKVDGRFAPGKESSLPGRTGYNGAGLVVMADPKNVVCLARAVLQYQNGAPQHYANFEKRANGKVDALGDATQYPIPEQGPVFLRIERRDQTIEGSFSSDGAKWHSLPPKAISGWPMKLQAGVIAISTSKEEFNPRFSEPKRWSLERRGSM